MRQEYVVAKSSRNPLKIFAEMISGAPPAGYTEMRCTICNTVMDLYANRVEAEVV
jgi:LSD1 subclass zinc finger protein